MAHFAKIDTEYTVTEVIVISNDVVNNLPFPDSEPLGVEFCKSLYGQNTRWAQTSYNGNFRYNYAGIGFEYLPTAGDGSGAFVAEKPYPSWVLNTTTYQWEAPIPYPDDGKAYYWDEATTSWVLSAVQPDGV